MKKSDLVAALSKELNIPGTTAFSIIKTIQDTMTEALVKGDNVEIRGFGSITVRNYNGYMGRKPKTGEQIEVKPNKRPFFKVGMELKKAVNNGTVKKT